MAGKKLDALPKARCAEDLYKLGFQSVATWAQAGDWLAYQTPAEGKHVASALLSAGNALYAFCIGTEVLYIGKTSQTLKKRFKGYCKPGSTQSTNQKCHALIKAALSLGQAVDIIAFAPPDDIQFRGFTINLAGGLEDILIRTFAPPWNGGAKGAALSETAIREITQLAEDADFSPEPTLEETCQANTLDTFMIRLTPTAYNRGIINPGQKGSDLLGADNDLLVIRFSDAAPPITTRIDRRANRNGSARLIGSNQAIASWLQANFSLDEIVVARIHGPSLIELMTNKHDSCVASSAAAAQKKREANPPLTPA